MTTRRPAEMVPPGEILKEELEARGWTQGDLAEIIGRHPNTVNGVIAGKRGISPDMARVLAAALGTSAELWLNLDAAYQLFHGRDDRDDDAVSRRAKLYAKAPVKEMVRRGWIEPSPNIAVLEERICQFLEIATIDAEPEALPHAARKSTAYHEPPTPSQVAWLYRARQLARAVSAKPYSARGLSDLVGRLRLLAHAPQEVRHVPRLLAEAGIKFVVVQPLPGSKIDGACLWDGETPIIAVSLRFDRLDNFWFVLFHELDHVRNGVESCDADIEATGDADRSPAEAAANAFAAETLIPSRQIDGFIARVGPLYRADRIEAFAQTMNVHPAVVVGQLQHRGEVAYSNFRKMLAPVREAVTAAALTDGWGVTVPILS